MCHCSEGDPATWTSGWDLSSPSAGMNRFKFAGVDLSTLSHAPRSSAIVARPPNEGQTVPPALPLSADSQLTIALLQDSDESPHHQPQTPVSTVREGRQSVVG